MQIILIQVNQLFHEGLLVKSNFDFDKAPSAILMVMFQLINKPRKLW